MLATPLAVYNVRVPGTGTVYCACVRKLHRYSSRNTAGNTKGEQSDSERDESAETWTQAFEIKRHESRMTNTR